MKNLLGPLLVLTIATAPALAQHEVQCPFTSINTNITTNTTLSSSTIYRVEDCISVTNNATLTIPAGTVVLFEKASGAGLTIEKGASLVVQGTAMNPVVFTSDQEPSFRAAGDYSGLLINGEATNNFTSNAMTTTARQCDVNAGGTDDDDNSGSIEFLRMEFPEYGLTLASVGRNTVLENIMVSYSNRNAFECWGGTFTARNLVAYNAGENDFVFNYGNRSKVQGALGMRLDPAANSGTAPNSNGVLIANNDAGSSYSGTPQTHPILDKFTIIGPSYCGATGLSSNFKNGVLQYHNASSGIYHFLIKGWNVGLRLEDAPTLVNATSTPPTLRFEGNSLAGYTTAYSHSGSWPSVLCATDMTNWMTNVGGCSQRFNEFSPGSFGYDASLCEDFCDNNTPSFIMSDDDLDDTYYAEIAELDEDDFFVASDFRGAFDETTDWTADWTVFCPQDYDYCPAQKRTGGPMEIDEMNNSHINLTVSPNPATATTYAEFTTTREGEVTLSLVNSLGQLVRHLSMETTKGQQRIAVSTLGLSSGVYTLGIVFSDGTTAHTHLMIK